MTNGRRSILRVLPKNIYRRENFSIKDGFWRTSKKGVWQGTLGGMTVSILSTLSIELTRPLNLRRLRELYFKQCRGMIGHDSLGGIIVRVKPFRRWIKQNASKILMTVAEMDRHETEIQKMWEDEYRLDFEEDMRRADECDEFCDNQGSCYDDEDYPWDDFEEDVNLIANALGQR
jgi:hypothetical protein